MMQQDASFGRPIVGVNRGLALMGWAWKAGFVIMVLLAED